jgi:transposase InsO family protein
VYRILDVRSAKGGHYCRRDDGAHHGASYDLQAGVISECDAGPADGRDHGYPDQHDPTEENHEDGDGTGGAGLPNPAGTIVHSDRGSQIRSNAYVRTLKNNGLLGSMGRVGACGDNAAMESFFSLLQKNVLGRQRWTTREELRLAIITWIERTYHRRRRQRRLGRLTPIEFEMFHQPVALAT